MTHFNVFGIVSIPCYMKWKNVDYLSIQVKYTCLLCIYVFIPSLNLQLSRFVEGWNNHPLLTEHSLSPTQLWKGCACITSDDIISQPDMYGVYTDVCNVGLSCHSSNLPPTDYCTDWPYSITSLPASEI